jgi:hypothetical protein
MQQVAEKITPTVLGPTQSIGVLKCRAAIAAYERRLDDAREAASTAVQIAKSEKSYAAGLAKALEDDLAELMETFRAAI